MKNLHVSVIFDMSIKLTVEKQKQNKESIKKSTF